MLRLKGKISRGSMVVASLVLILIFYSLSIKTNVYLPWHQQIVVAVLAPLQKSITFLGRGAVDIWSHYFALVGVERENKRLRKEVDEKGFELKRLAEIELENARLRALMGFRERHSLDAIGAEVIANDPRGDFRVVSVDKGRLDDVSVNMPVVSSAGLVGRVADVAASTSRVLLITDPNNAVDVVVQRSRARSLMLGAIGGAEVSRRYLSRLEYLDKRSDIIEGDVLVTSGVDGIYPSGIPVGVVRDLRNDESGVFKDAEVVPFTDFSNLEEVLIVKR